tara:strand:- start:695 stop:1084 length:390 start_codon:yes stop_codon:yes gene_type:complete
MSTILVNTLTGTSTAGSIVVTGEGNSTTTNLQQGLAKAWCSVNHDSTTTFYDSFNFASVTDNGTGDYTVTFTNAMSGTRYSPVTGCYSADGDITNAANEATTSHKIRVFDDTGSAKDVDCFSTTHGDLA